MTQLKIFLSSLRTLKSALILMLVPSTLSLHPINTFLSLSLTLAVNLKHVESYALIFSANLRSTGGVT